MSDTIGIFLAHWPFVSFALIVAIVGQVLKATVWTQKRAETNKRGGWFFWWGRKTLPLHPVVFGALVGLIPGIPTSEDVNSIAARALYYAAAGVVSTWLFSIIRSIAKRQGIVLAPVAEEASCSTDCSCNSNQKAENHVVLE